MSIEVNITDLGEVLADGDASPTEGFVPDVATRAEAKNYIKQQYGTVTLEDSLVDDILQGARQWIEQYIKRSIITKTVVAYTNSDFAKFTLPLSPVSAVTKVERVDFEGNSTTLTRNTDYLQEGDQEISLYFYGVWGTVNGGSTAGYRVTYTAKMATVPDALKVACLKLCAENYYNRLSSGESSRQSISLIPFDVRASCKPFRKFIL